MKSKLAAAGMLGAAFLTSAGIAIAQTATPTPTPTASPTVSPTASPRATTSPSPTATPRTNVPQGAPSTGAAVE